MKTINKTYYTFVTTGLTDYQIKFLGECEKLFFKGVDIDLNFLETVLDKIKFVKGSPEANSILEAWDYWKDLLRPKFRNSYKKPIKLSKLFSKVDKGLKLYYNVNQFVRITPKNLLSEFQLSSTLDLPYYYEIIQGNKLYLRYETIIGSTFIAFIENDF